jgi:type VI secretion system secreted protein VgrG
VTFGEHAEAGARARRTAQMRAQRWSARSKVFSAAGPAFGVRAGYLFELEDHPRLPYNAAYLATEVVYEGDQLAGAVTPHRGLRTWLVRVTAIAADAQFRPPAVAPWPRAQNLELAVVDGPVESEYAQLDEHGRYLVKLRFDENSHTPGTASTRVRMMQPHAGEPEGMHLPLRKGTEVLIAFLGGDPDQPVIAGAVPDAEHPSVVVQANETQNVIHTGGNNRIEMEDTADHQYIDLYSPPEHTALHLGKHHPRGYHGGHDHNFVLTTDGDGLVHTGTNLDITVGGQKHEHVCKLVDEKYDLTQTTTVKSDVTETYGANQDTAVTSHTEETYGSHVVKVKGAQVEACQTQTTTVRTVLLEKHDSQETTVTGALAETTPIFKFDVTRASSQRNGTLTWTIAPGATTINAGTSFDMTAPSFNLIAAMTHTLTTPDRQETGLLRNLLTGIHIKYGVVKTAVTGVAGAMAGFKMDVVPGVNLAAYLFKLDLSAVSVGIAGAKASFNAVTLRMGPIKVKITGSDMKV